MPDDSKTYQLIIRQRPADHPELEILLQELQSAFGLDSYTARQRLIGPGLAQFGKGLAAKTEKIASLLQRYGFACWLVEPQKPAFAADLLRSLEIRNDSVIFTCQKGLVRLERGAAVVGVLADLSGGLADKHVKRLMAQHAYRGSHALEVLSHEEMVRTTLLGQPVFDFYRLNAQGNVEQAVQVMPGRFSVDGLGSRASVSSTQNLQALITLVEEYAGPFRMYCDFGLSQLPGCDVKKATDSPSAVLENLASLSRYGWLVTRLQGDGRPARDQTPGRSGLMTAGTIVAVAASAQPGLATAACSVDNSAANPGLDEVAREISKESGDGGGRSEEQANKGIQPGHRALPQPPERPIVKPYWGKPLVMIGAAAVGFLIAAGGDHGSLLRMVSRYGLTTGVFPALASVPLLWGGLHFLQLKRRIENTPTSKVRSLAMGLVEVHGRAQRLYALVAPMTQSACVWYRLRKYRKDNKNNWKLVKEINSDHVPFQLDDGTGRVTVDPSGADVKAKVHQSGYPGQSPLTFTAFGSGFGEDEKWIEDLIYEGTSIYVLGYARPEREERLSLRDRTTAKLRQLKLDPQAMHRYDTNSDGLIDEVEWQDARNDAEQAALSEHLAEDLPRRRQEDHVVISNGPQRSLPFIITETISESDLVRKYGLFSLCLMLAGLGTMALALYQLLQYLKLFQ